MILSETTVVQPDIVFIVEDRAVVVADRGADGVPTLAIEVLSPLTAGHDRGMKKALDARYGLPSLRLLDSGDESLEAYELRSDGYVRAVRRAVRSEPGRRAGMTRWSLTDSVSMYGKMLSHARRALPGLSDSPSSRASTELW